MWVLALAILVALWGPFFLGVVHDLPFGFHAWKQADCLALAQRYLEDGNWNILTPRTQSLIPVDGRVNAELPLVPYLAAVLARVAGGAHLVPVFRTLTILFTALAPLGLFGLVWGRTRGLPESLLASVFVATCPVLVYYGAGFHPDPAAFGLTTLGLSLVLGWRADQAPGTAAVTAGIALMGLGGLLKMSLAPYLAVAAVLLLHRARREAPGLGLAGTLRRIPRGPVITLTASLGLAGAQFLALRFLAAAYEPTFFTAKLHPFRSPGDMVRVARRAWNIWLGFLFTRPQLVILAAALAFLVIRSLRRHRLEEPDLALAVSAWVMVGLFVLFGRQFIWHDYYAIATFYPTAILAVIPLARWIRRRRSAARTSWGRTGWALVTLLAAASMAAALPPTLATRTTPFWRRFQVRWLDDAKLLLAECGLGCAGSIAVLGSEPPNLALARLDRPGYVLGKDLGGGIGVPPFPDARAVARYLDLRGVHVLLVRRDLLETPPCNGLLSWYRVAGRRGGAVLLLRRGNGPAAHERSGPAPADRRRQP